MMSRQMSLLHPLLLAVSLAMAACVSAAPPAPLVNVPIKLAMGSSAELQPGLSISFDRVEDSRCPQGVQCVWAGQLLYFLSLHGSTVVNFDLSTKAPSFSTAGLTIRLDDEHQVPPPVSGQPPPPYTVMLLVNSN
jgi:hypothetical protein